jgi:predicted ABC-class ATPase
MENFLPNKLGKLKFVMEKVQKIFSQKNSEEFLEKMYKKLAQVISYHKEIPD